MESKKMKFGLGILALLACAFIAAVPVSADSVNVTGTVSPSVSMTISGGDVVMPLNIGTNDLTTSKSVAVTANVPFQIKMKDEYYAYPLSGGAGCMKGSAHDGKQIADKMQVSLNGVYTPLDYVDQTIHSQGAGTFSQPLKLRQVVAVTDPILPGGQFYELQIIVTGAATP